MSWLKRKPRPVADPAPDVEAETLDAASIKLLLDEAALRVTLAYLENGYAAMVVRGEGNDLSIIGPHLPALTGHRMLTHAAEVYRLTEGLPTQQ